MVQIIPKGARNTKFRAPFGIEKRRLMMAILFEMVGGAFIAITALMLILWVVYFFQRNASIVDIGWSFSFFLAAWIYFFIGVGSFWRSILLTLMCTIWSLRLSLHLYRRYRADSEDPRYKEMMKNWGAHVQFKALLMFLFQGMLALILTLPFIIVALDSSSSHSFHDYAWGIGFWIVGIAGEAIADQQLYKFKQNPENQGKICKKGLWRFSRHPNYFFEWLVWVGYFLYALPSPGGSIAIISPILMLALLLKVSGIPLAEAESLRTKGDEYREYQRTTSPFIPWFPHF